MTWRKRLAIWRNRLYLYPPAEEMPRTRLFWLAMGLVGLAAAIFSTYFIYLHIGRQDAYLTTAEDLGTYNQAVWSILHGLFLHQTICTIVSDTNCYSLNGVSRFAIHFEPILLPISLTYLALPDPKTLLVLQTLVVASGAFPAFWLARLRLRNELIAVGIAVLYLLYPALQQAEALQPRIDALEKRPVSAEPDLGPLEARITALEKRAEQPPAPAPLPPEVASLAPRLDALAARMEQLAAREEQLATQEQQLATHEQQLAGQVQSGQAGLDKRLEAVEGRIGAVEQQSGKLSGLADRAGRVAHIQAAEAALDAGLPIGEFPDAPPALARFATTAPPTEAALRLAFPAAAQAAAAAAGPETSRMPFWHAVERRFESLVTVRRGDQVILGNPVDGTIARAARALDAGDLAGAVAAVSQLQGGPAQAFASWRTQAESLLEARRALAALAAHAALTAQALART